MLELNLNHVRVDFKEAALELEKIKTVSLPDFARFQTDLDEIKRITRKYAHFQNVLIVGNGGAINSFRGIYSCLGLSSKKKVEIINTPEPDYLFELKKCYPRETSLLVIISKSGTNPTALEMLFAFHEYPILAICTEGLGALYQIVKREKLDYLKYPSEKEYPALDDRHTGISASGLVPAALLGLDLQEIYLGAKDYYQKCSPAISIEDNPALQLATIFYLLEKRGYEQIFCPVYSTKLFGFLPLIIQLLHETVCKDGKGQSVFGDLAPESQHHTNQRLFGGKKNILGFFLTAEQDDQTSRVEIPSDLTDLSLRGGILNDFAEITYSQLLDFEFKGTFNDALENKIPVVHLHLKEISPRSVGQFIAFFQYLAYYSAILRDVNPLGQPQVERSKEITFGLIKNSLK